MAALARTEDRTVVEKDEAGAADDSTTDDPQEAGGPSVGDLVVIPVARVREQVGCGEHAGVVIEDRRNVVKAFFPDIDRAFWLDRDKVLVIDEQRLPLHPLTRRLHRISAALGVELVEIYDREGDAEIFHLYTRGTDLAALDGVRALLGADFRRMGIDPGGVRRARVTLVFRTSPI